MNQSLGPCLVSPLFGVISTRALLVSVAGDKVVRFAPPYIVERAQLDEAVAIVRAVLADGAGK